MTEPSSLEHAREVLRQRKEGILRTYKAIGVGIGKHEPQGKSYGIVVYLESEQELPKEGAISIEGVPLRFEVTGRIKPL